MERGHPKNRLYVFFLYSFCQKKTGVAQPGLMGSPDLSFLFAVKPESQSDFVGPGSKLLEFLGRQIKGIE